MVSHVGQSSLRTKNVAVLLSGNSQHICLFLFRNRCIPENCSITKIAVDFADLNTPGERSSIWRVLEIFSVNLRGIHH